MRVAPPVTPKGVQHLTQEQWAQRSPRVYWSEARIVPQAAGRQDLEIAEQLRVPNP
jgi:hypothetical protein